MPVAKLFSAPYVQLCESAPTISSPGRTSPFSGSTVWQMPPCPTSKYHLMPIWCENSRVSRPSVALAASLAGWKWSCVTATRSGSQIFSSPICSLMIFPSGGMVRSWPIAKSTFASTRSPGRTESRPAPRARIFSVIVMPMFLVPEPPHDSITGLGGGKVPADVARALTGANGRFDRTLDRFCHFVMTQVLDHHTGAQDGPDRVHEALAGDVRRGPVDGLEQAPTGLRVDVGGRRDAHTSHELGGEVAEDVAEEVARDNDLELTRVLDELHGGGIDEEMAGLDGRMGTSDILPAFLPQAAREGHRVGLVDHHDLVLGDLVGGAFLESATHADVGALGVLANDHQVHTPALLATQR